MTGRLEFEGAGSDSEMSGGKQEERDQEVSTQAHWDLTHDSWSKKVSAFAVRVLGLKVVGDLSGRVLHGDYGYLISRMKDPFLGRLVSEQSSVLGIFSPRYLFPHLW